MTRTSSSATRAATNGPTTYPPPTGSPANSAVASSRSCGRLGSLRDLRAGFQDPLLVERRPGRDSGRMAPPHREYPARSQASLRAAASDLLPILEHILRELGKGRTKRQRLRASPRTNFSSMGQGNLPSAAPRGTMGFRERSSLSTTTDRACRSAAERFPARIRTRWTSAGRCGPANWRRNLVRGGVDEARVTLGWAPGGDAPFLVEASTSQGNVNLQVPRQELPPGGMVQHQGDRSRPRIDRTGLGG